MISDPSRMSQNNLTTSDLAVLEHLSDTPQIISQREIARRSGLSVGLINAILKKLVHTGYVKTSNLNRRTIQYILTPQGFAEKARKSYRYILRTVKQYRLIKVRFIGLLDSLASEGVKNFYLHGDGELAELVATFCADGGYTSVRRGLPQYVAKEAVVLNAAELPVRNVSARVINLAEVFANGDVSSIANQENVSF